MSSVGGQGEVSTHLGQPQLQLVPERIEFRYRDSSKVGGEGGKGEEQQAVVGHLDLMVAAYAPSNYATIADVDSVGNRMESDRSSSCSKTTTRRTKLPTVVLLGWFGSQYKDLLKYASIYWNKGHNVVAFIAPNQWVLRAVFGDIEVSGYAKLHAALAEYFTTNSSSNDRIKRTISKDIDKDKDQDNRLVFHIFSNGGAFFYEYLLCLKENSLGLRLGLGLGLELGAKVEGIEEDDRLLSLIDGFIFDSAPIDLSDTAIINTANSIASSVVSYCCRMIYTIWRSVRRERMALLIEDTISADKGGSKYSDLDLLFAASRRRQSSSSPPPSSSSSSSSSYLSGKKIGKDTYHHPLSRSQVELRRLQFYYRLAHADTISAHRLYLYSASDDIASPTMIRLLAARSKRFNNSKQDSSSNSTNSKYSNSCSSSIENRFICREVDFSAFQSRHVQHFRTAPELYASAVLSFLRDMRDGLNLPICSSSSSKPIKSRL